MRVVSVVALAASCAAFAPSSVGRPATSLGVHRPQLKAAKKANRLRPKKHAPSDINRKPPSYAVEPQYYEGRPEEYVVPRRPPEVGGRVGAPPREQPRPDGGARRHVGRDVPLRPREDRVGVVGQERLRGAEAVPGRERGEQQ